MVNMANERRMVQLRTFAPLQRSQPVVELHEYQSQNNQCKTSHIHNNLRLERGGGVNNDAGCWIVARTHLETPHYDVQLVILAEIAYQIMIDRVDGKHEVQSI